MVSQKAPDGDLETMETHQHQTEKPYQARYNQTQSMGICEHQKRLLAYRQELDPVDNCHQHAVERIGVCVLDRMLPECSKTRLRNRRIPNGTYGGVRGQVGN